MSATETEAEVTPQSEDPDWDGQGVEGVDPEEATPPMQIPIPGTIETISLNAGGPKPTSSEARLQGGSLHVEGQFANDELVTLIVEARVSDVTFPISRDKYGNAVKIVRRHLLKPVGIRRLNE